MKLQNTVEKEITTLAGIRRKFLKGKAKENILSLKNPNHINKIYGIA